jgi:hypothetical protein
LYDPFHFAPLPVRSAGLPIEMRATSPTLSGCAEIRFQELFTCGRYSLRARADALPSVEYLDTNSGSGVPMPRYLTQHTLACLTRQGAEALAQRMQAGGLAHAERILVNMLEGKMFVEFRADSRENLEAWLKTEGMHFDFLVRIEWEMHGDKLQIAD